MSPLGHVEEHFWLVQRMAKVTKTDLAAAMAEGRLTSSGWSEMVTRCRGCTSACACKDWLAAVELSAEGPLAPPASCENRAMFARKDFATA